MDTEGRQPITAIRGSFSAASIDELGFLISWHEDDERRGVADLVKRAKKRIAAHEAEVRRTRKMYELQRELQSSGAKIVVGIDEVGRGSVAGPLSVAAVALPLVPPILGLKDSKELSPHRREELAEEIKHHALAVGFSHIPPHEIDRCGMGVCIRSAMRRALDDTGIDLGSDVAVLIDGRPVHIHPSERAIVAGDATQACIAAASIVAKVVRDRHLVTLDDRFPGYDLAHSKGYASAKHIEAIRSLGLTEIHRVSFCKNFIESPS